MFIIGNVYRRQTEIHDVLGGQKYGGISTPSRHPYVVIFTSDAGSSYGYSDRFMPDGLFYYTGEGRRGDMVMQKGNRAILEHREFGKKLLVFESVARKGGLVKFVGEADCVGWHNEPRPDESGTIRNAIIFHLAFTSAHGDSGSETDALTSRISASMSLNRLRSLAMTSAPDTADTVTRQVIARVRSQAVKLYALKRASGVCECCGNSAPFETKAGPYLEVHHMHRISDDGPDDPENVAAICPNCHREIHYGSEGAQLNKKVIAVIGAKERETVC